MRRDREAALGVDGVDGLDGRHPGMHELGRPQAEDVPVGALDLLADDDLDGVALRAAIAAASSPPAFVLWSVIAMTARSVFAQTQSRTSSGEAVPSEAVVCMCRSAEDQVSCGMAGRWYPMRRRGVSAARRRTGGDLRYTSAERVRRGKEALAPMLTSDFDYDLPSGLIAQEPADPRDSCRLLVLDRASGQIDHRVFTDVVEYVRPGDLLVVNETRVLPARLMGVKEGTGGEVEVLLLRERAADTWECLVGRAASCSRARGCSSATSR